MNDGGVWGFSALLGLLWPQLDTVVRSTRVQQCLAEVPGQVRVQAKPDAGFQQASQNERPRSLEAGNLSFDYVQLMGEVGLPVDPVQGVQDGRGHFRTGLRLRPGSIAAA